VSGYSGDMSETERPSILTRVHANLPRAQAVPKLPTSSLFPPEPIPWTGDFNPEWSDWRSSFPIYSLRSG
jgi:hypothetical protein